MSSYFDLPPQQQSGTTNIDAVPENERKQLGQMSLLSPAVTQLLDDLEKEPSDSDEEEGSLSEPDDTKHVAELTKKAGPAKQGQNTLPKDRKPAKSSLSPNKGDRSPQKKSAHVRLSPARPGGGSAKPKQPHMARFHSLRSMLFSSTIEDKMKTMSQEDCEKEEAAAKKWKEQHSERQMHARPKTPEKDAQGKDGLGSRIKTKIRRITSKEVPTMETLKEDGVAHDFSDHGSTASSDNEEEQYRWRPRDADESSIDHSDVEELVRWVSRRDPPSDGEARRNVPDVSEPLDDSDHESLGHSDVDDLVRFVSRRSAGPETRQDHHTGYSDASTESDSEMLKEHDSSEEENADDLVRWISHRDGPIAGPVRQKRQDADSTKAESHLSYDSDVPELGRWIKRHDGTSGESGATTPAHDLLEEPERGRPRSRDGPSRQQAKSHLTHDDVDELVRWVSRKDSKQSASPKPDHDVQQLQHQEEKKKQKLGMTVDEGSLSHSDVKELIEHVRSKSMDQDPETARIAQVEDVKKQQLGMSVDEGSLSHSDVKDLIEHVRTSSLAPNENNPPDATLRAGEAESGDLRTLRSEPETTDGAKSGELASRNRSERGSIGSMAEEDVDELVRWVSQKH
ncbi:hypothetical protein FB567DRAFT_515137 [Paraphoma chrysanthemicola]|uniref:Uncharacterized protein n=1 Tax=Paraphoma chrysanthemicola TaxID=798071 RepID=A0A8K0W3H9_9PLEO|nr:hypothetical protein FB567DRAFT_515137 [Paraphoma chrysanthemicola]